MLLLTQHADVAFRDCKDCWLHLYNEKTGEREIRGGKPVRRPKWTKPPCMQGACKKGTPDAFQVLLPQNEEAYQHYQECRATGHFPDDALVRHNARIIKEVEDLVQKAERQQELVLITLSRKR